MSRMESMISFSSKSNKFHSNDDFNFGKLSESFHIPKVSKLVLAAVFIATNILFT